MADVNAYKQNIRTRVQALDFDMLTEWRAYMLDRESSSSTIERYQREIRRFYHCLFEAGIEPGEAFSLLRKEDVLAFRAKLAEVRSPSGVNVAVAALNSLFRVLGRDDLCVKGVRIQACGARSPKVNLTYEEYKCLVKAAERVGDMRMALIFQSLCSIGLRVSELSCLKFEALEIGSIWVSNKGKTRMAYIPDELSILLSRYCYQKGIQEGSIFVGTEGAPLSRATIWRGMKSAAKEAGIAQEKAYPHNLRHLFALRYYEKYRDLDAVSDALGHSRLETTRVYIATTDVERRRQISSLGLVVQSDDADELRPSMSPCNGMSVPLQGISTKS